MRRFLWPALLLAPLLVSRATGQELEWEREPAAGRLVTGGFVVLRGWAFEPAAGQPVSKMEVFLDGKTRGDVLIRRHRHDIAARKGKPEYLWSGWAAFLSLRDAAPGPHRVDVLAYGPSGRQAVSSEVIFIRPFPSPPTEPSGRTYTTLLLRAAILFLWLSLLGWGPLRWVARGPAELLAPGAGLALLGVAMEAGASADVRPLGSALALTALSLLLLAASLVRHRRPKKPCHTAAVALAAALLFAAVAAIPLAAHGRGAVLGGIVDAAWESSVGDSIARFGWTLPSGMDGHLVRVPAGWRGADFRAGAPYLLALLAQTFGIRSHEAHGILVLAAGALVICATGALSARLFRTSRPARWLAISLGATSSVLFSALYTQHAGILVATALFLTFLSHLLTLIRARRGRAVLPVAWTIAGTMTLYPEMIALWIWTAALGLSLAGSRRQSGRALLRLVVATALAASLNPVALARTVRWFRALPGAPVLATPEQRTVFGDIHYFPSLRVSAGIEPLRLDAPVSSSWRIRALRWLAVLLFAAALPAGFLLLSGWERKVLLLLLVPAAVGLLANRLLQFPYGYSKALQHAAALWPLVLALALAGLARRWIAPAAALALLALSLSVWSARDTVSRALRSVPTLDPVFLSLEELTRTLGRDAVLVTSEPDFGRREWMAYFVGENFLAYAVEGEAVAAELSGRRLFRIRDLRQSAPATADTASRANAFFLLTRVPS